MRIARFSLFGSHGDYAFIQLQADGIGGYHHCTIIK